MVSKVLENEAQEWQEKRIFEILEDMKKRAQGSRPDALVDRFKSLVIRLLQPLLPIHLTRYRAQTQSFNTLIPMNIHDCAIIPSTALSEGPAKLAFDCQSERDPTRSLSDLEQLLSIIPARS